MSKRLRRREEKSKKAATKSSVAIWQFRCGVGLRWVRFACLFVVLHSSNTTEVISGWAPTCDGAHSWRLLECCLTGILGHHHHDLVSHSVTLSNQSLPYPNNVERQARKRQVSFFKLLIWLNQGLNQRGSDSLLSQNERRALYSFSHPAWSGDIRRLSPWKSCRHTTTCLGLGVASFPAQIVVCSSEIHWIVTATSASFNLKRAQSRRQLGGSR